MALDTAAQHVARHAEQIEKTSESSIRETTLASGPWGGLVAPMGAHRRARVRGGPLKRGAGPGRERLVALSLAVGISDRRRHVRVFAGGDVVEI